jgi:hypothetical protein
MTNIDNLIESEQIIFWLILIFIIRWKIDIRSLQDLPDLNKLKYNIFNNLFNDLITFYNINPDHIIYSNIIEKNDNAIRKYKVEFSYCKKYILYKIIDNISFITKLILSENYIFMPNQSDILLKGIIKTSLNYSIMYLEMNRNYIYNILKGEEEKNIEIDKNIEYAKKIVKKIEEIQKMSQFDDQKKLVIIALFYIINCLRDNY